MFGIAFNVLLPARSQPQFPSHHFKGPTLPSHRALLFHEPLLRLFLCQYSIPSPARLLLTCLLTVSPRSDPLLSPGCLRCLFTMPLLCVPHSGEALSNCIVNNISLGFSPLDWELLGGRSRVFLFFASSVPTRSLD